MARTTRKRIACTEEADESQPIRASKRSKTSTKSSLLYVNTNGASKGKHISLKASSSSPPPNINVLVTAVRRRTRCHLSTEDLEAALAQHGYRVGETVDYLLYIFRKIFKDYHEQVNSVKPEFMTLPRELRDLIYNELFIASNVVTIKQESFNRGVKSDITFPLALTRTNKQVSSEALEVFYSKNVFKIDMNMLTTVQWLASLSPRVSGNLRSISIAKSLMTGYIHNGYGLFDNGRLRSELVNKLIYSLDMDVISIEVPDEPTPPPLPNGTQHAHFIRNLEYSWCLARDLLDTILVCGNVKLRLCYPSMHTSTSTTELKKLHSIRCLKYLDDEYETEAMIKQYERARRAGKLPEFETAEDVKAHVRQKRRVRDFDAAYTPTGSFETGTVVTLAKPGELGVI